MRFLGAIFAGFIVGALVGANIADSWAMRNSKEELQARYSQGYIDGWFEVAALIKKNFEKSRSPSEDEKVIDHLFLKATDIYIVQKDGGTNTILYVE
jgi:hypothetical protein